MAGIVRHFMPVVLSAAAIVAAAGSAQTPATTTTAAPRPTLSIVADARALPRIRPTREADRSAYLMVYFKDETHSLYFATSRDGYRFTDVNSGEPVMQGRAVAEQKGIRDPHIMRGPDGAFYMAMTDLHIFAQREGLRATEWERPGDAYGWGNNRNMLLMKSTDLIHWTLSKVTVANLFPAFRDAGATWAPETIYDPTTRRLMVYFTVRDGNKPTYMVYSYADANFTTLTEQPRTLFDYPNKGVPTLDGDITRIGDKYRMFYVVHEKPGNIRQAVSTTINGGYVYDPRKVDPETKAAEAPTLWRRHGTDRYVLMYDVFGARPNNMGFAETSDFKTFRNLGHFNDAGSPMKATNFVQPKHGAVTAITPGEAERIERFFGGRR